MTLASDDGRQAFQIQDRFRLRIIGFGKPRDQEKFFAEVRNAALKERRALKNWIL